MCLNLVNEKDFTNLFVVKEENMFWGTSIKYPESSQDPGGELQRHIPNFMN